MSVLPSPTVDDTRFRPSGLRPLTQGDRRYEWEQPHFRRIDAAKVKEEPRKSSKIAISSLLCDTKYNDRQSNYDDETTEDGDNLDESDNTSESPRPYAMFDGSTATSVTSPTSSTWGDKMDHDSIIDDELLSVKQMKLSDQLPPLSVVEPPPQYFQKEPSLQTPLPRISIPTRGGGGGGGGSTTIFKPWQQQGYTLSEKLPSIHQTYLERPTLTKMASPFSSQQPRLTSAEVSSPSEPKWPVHLSRLSRNEEIDTKPQAHISSDLIRDNRRSVVQPLHQPQHQPQQPQFSPNVAPYYSQNANNHYNGTGFRPVRRSMDDHGAMNYYDGNHNRALAPTSHTPYASGFQHFKEQEYRAAPQFPRHMDEPAETDRLRPSLPRYALPSSTSHSSSGFSPLDHASSQAHLQRPTPIVAQASNGVSYRGGFHSMTSPPPPPPPPPQQPIFSPHHHHHRNMSHSSIYSSHSSGGGGGGGGDTISMSGSRSNSMVDREAPSPAPPNPNYSQLLKAKRKRANANQLQVLNDVFQHTFFPSTEMRIQLGKQLGMSPRTVQIWFQNKRQSWRTKNKQPQSETGCKDMDGMEEHGAGGDGLHDEDEYDKEHDGESTITSPTSVSISDLISRSRRTRRRSSLSSMSIGSSCEDPLESRGSVPPEQPSLMALVQNRSEFKNGTGSKAQEQRHFSSRYDPSYDQQQRVSSPPAPAPKFSPSVMAEFNRVQGSSPFSDHQQQQQQQQQQRPFAALNASSSSSSASSSTSSLFESHPPRLAAAAAAAAASKSDDNKYGHDRDDKSRLSPERRMSPKLSHSNYRQHPYQPQGNIPKSSSQNHSNDANPDTPPTGRLTQTLPSPAPTLTPPLSLSAGSPVTTPPSRAHATTPTLTSPREAGFHRVQSPTSSSSHPFSRQHLPHPTHSSMRDRDRDREVPPPRFPPSVTRSSQFLSFGAMAGSATSSSSSPSSSSSSASSSVVMDRDR
ncbi:hypothetical protein BC937DRAFT_94669 [Endogone sp. FLAS-F59071]|nr:hypothetical protein BC937DRAFT_94669 [Endogone sp. FLAS-F59071]|eukprot:RUS13861.1 hypothetical protein BC937DRAFT_94669 [Endogone sp. FLAS-F59071]